MADRTEKADPVETGGALPALNSMAPDFQLTKTDFSDVSLADFAGKKIVLNIFMSIDTPVCATSVRKFNSEAEKLDDTVVLCISADLPFALKRFCGTEGLVNVIPLSVFRSGNFGRDYGVIMTSGALSGLLTRAVIIINRKGRIVYTEQVPDIGNEPDYAAALDALKKI